MTVLSNGDALTCLGVTPSAKHRGATIRRPSLALFLGLAFLMAGCSDPSSTPSPSSTASEPSGPALVVTLEPAGSGASTAALAADATIFVRRARDLGLANNVSVSTSHNTIVLDVRGSRAQADLAELTRSAQQYFRPVIAAAPAYSPPAAGTTYVPSNIINLVPAMYRFTSADYSTANGGTFTPPSAWASLASYQTTAPLSDNPEYPVLLADSQDEYGPRLLLGPAQATSTITKTATVTPLGSAGQWTLLVSLTGPGTTIFNALAAQDLHTPLANDLGATVQSAPIINSSNFDAGIQIVGGSSGFTHQQASRLALLLTSGAVPLPLRVVTTQTSG